MANQFGSNLVLKIKHGPVNVQVWGPTKPTQIADWLKTYIHIFRYVQSTKNPGAWDKEYRLRARDIPEFKRALNELAIWFRDWKSRSPVRPHFEFIHETPAGLGIPYGYKKTFFQKADPIVLEFSEPIIETIRKDYFHSYLDLFRFVQSRNDNLDYNIDRRFTANDVENLIQCSNSFLNWFKGWGDNA